MKLVMRKTPKDRLVAMNMRITPTRVLTSPRTVAHDVDGQKQRLRRDQDTDNEVQVGKPVKPALVSRDGPRGGPAQKCQERYRHDGVQRGVDKGHAQVELGIGILVVGQVQAFRQGEGVADVKLALCLERVVENDEQGGQKPAGPQAS